MLNCHFRRRRSCNLRTVYIHLPKMIAIKKRFVIALFQAAHYLIWTQTLITLWLLLFVSVHSEYIFHTVQLSGTHAEWSCIACIFFSPLQASFSRGLQEFRIWWHPLHDVSSYPAEEEKHRQKIQLSWRKKYNIIIIRIKLVLWQQVLYKEKCPFLGNFLETYIDCQEE